MARILLVDDDAEGLELRRTLLEHHGHRIETASSPADARSRCNTFSPDCVIADLHLPDAAAGRAFLSELRQAAPLIRIIVLSGRPAASESFADVVLLKPVRSEQLIAAVAPPV